VWTGALTWVDRFAVRHLMPGLDPRSRASPLLQQLVPFHDPDRPLDVLADTSVLPGNPLVSTALVLWLAWLLRGRRAAIAAAFAGAVVVEIALKRIVTRPVLTRGGVHVVVFDDSFPSGHATRVVFVAVLAALLWRRAGRWIALWVAAALVLLDLDGWHTPTDILGGAVLGLLGALLAWGENPIPARLRTALRKPSKGGLLVRKLLVVPVLAAALVLSSDVFAATPKLVGTVGPGFTITLRQASKKVTTLKAGTYLFVVTDKAAIHNFVLEKQKGGTFEKDVTTVAFTGTKSVKIKLTAGKWKYYCRPHEPTMFGFFTVT
jgi:membrane-associated phospholipid phosphatase/plastocyanin